MVKAMFVVHRNPSMDHEEFKRYWRDVHAPIAAKIPGLRKYVINPAIPGTSGEGGAPFDGVAELYFDSIEAYQTAFADPQGVATMEDAAIFLSLDRVRAIVAEEISIL